MGYFIIAFIVGIAIAIALLSRSGRDMRDASLIIIFFLGYALLVITPMLAIAWVAYHFINKYW